MKKEIPILLGFFATIGWFLEFFFAGVFFENWKMFFTTGFRTIAVVGIIIGIYSILARNFAKIKYNNDRYYSIFQLGIIALMIILGILRGTASGTPFNAMFTYAFVPINATIFSMLAFYVASAAYRSFRAKSIESVFLLVAAIIVMLGKLPVGEAISGYIPVMAEWIMDGPTSAGRRAILFGSLLGGMTMMIRIFFGLERSHLSD